MVMFKLWRAHRRFRRAPYSLRHHRSSHHVVGALFTDGGPGNAWPQGWWKSKSRDTHGCLTRTLPGFGSVTDAFTNWEELWSTN